MTVLSPAELAFNMTAELYRYGAAREVAGEHEEGDRITSANRTRAEAERIGGRILDHYNHLLAAYNALEERGSKLTREMDLKVDEIERQAEELTVLERNLRRAQKVADDRGEEIQRLKAELRRRNHPTVRAVADLVEEMETQFRRAEAAHDAKDEANRRWLEATTSTPTPEQLARRATFAEAIGIAVRGELEAGESE